MKNNLSSLNKEEPDAVLSNKNHSGGLDGSEDHADGKVFSRPGSERCPVQTIIEYIFYLNPKLDALFQRPKDISVRFSPGKDWTGVSGSRGKIWATTRWKMC